MRSICLILLLNKSVTRVQVHNFARSQSIELTTFQIRPVMSLFVRLIEALEFVAPQYSSPVGAPEFDQALG